MEKVTGLGPERPIFFYEISKKAIKGMSFSVPNFSLPKTTVAVAVPTTSTSPPATAVPTTTNTSYATKLDLTRYQPAGNYVTSSYMQEYLSPFTKKTDLQEYQKRGNYAMSTDLMGYMPRKEMDKYATVDYVQQGYMAKTDMGTYALKSDVPKMPDLSPYALKTEVPKDYATMDALKNYAAKTDLGPYALKIEIPQLPDLSTYALKAELPKLPDLSNYAFKTDIPKLATTNQDMMDAPTTYYGKGAGLHQELKTRKSLVSQVGNTEYPQTGQYLCAVETVVPGSSEQAGNIIQYAKCGVNSNYVRESYSPTAWNEWSRIGTTIAPQSYNLEGGAVKSIAFSHEGNLYGLGLDNKIWMRRPADKGWQLMTQAEQAIQNIAFAKDGRLMSVSNDGFLYVKATDINSPWVKMEQSCCIKDVTVGPGGYLYGVGLGNTVSRSKTTDPNSSWDEIANTGAVTNITFKDGYLFGVGMDNQIYRKITLDLTGQWMNLGMAGVKALTTGPDNEIWAAMLDGQVRRPMIESADYVPFGTPISKTGGTKASVGQLNALAGVTVDCPAGSALTRMQMQSVPGKAEFNYVWSCAAANDFGAIRDVNTGAQDSNEGNPTYLDRHNMQCQAGEAITAWTAKKPTDKTIQFDYKCAAVPGLTKCTKLNTQWDNDGAGNVHFLDRHNVNCPKNSVLTGLKLTLGADKTYRYDYTCCSR